MNNRKELIRSYLKRLNDGESMETVRKDFVSSFCEVDATEIMQAEQELIAEGTPAEEITKLCDIHSALFHKGAVQEDASAIRKLRSDKTKELVSEPGHPLNTFARENKAMAELIEEAKQALLHGDLSDELLGKLREIAIHYAKKGDLLYPHLKVAYGISGPSEVMWSVDDEIRDELNKLSKAKRKDEEWIGRAESVLTRAEEMIFKEENILFPNCAVNFSVKDWIGIYHDAKDYQICLGVIPEWWETAEKAGSSKSSKAYTTEVSDSNGKITEEGTDGCLELCLLGGRITVAELTALLNTIPIEITFVDTDNINRYFNEGPKDFKRPKMAIGREVFSCHPPKVEMKVRHIIEEFRNGTLDEIPIWMEKNGKTMLVKYLAVRDKHNNYLGTLELVQDMSFAKEHFTAQQ